jgi:hypothetical protein
MKILDSIGMTMAQGFMMRRLDGGMRLILLQIHIKDGPLIAIRRIIQSDILIQMG